MLDPWDHVLLDRIRTAVWGRYGEGDWYKDEGKECDDEVSGHTAALIVLIVGHDGEKKEESWHKVGTKSWRWQ